MIGFLSAYDENEKSVSKEKITFVHICSDSDEDVRQELSSTALQFARYYNLEKVYLFYGKDKKIEYDYSNLIGQAFFSGFSHL